MHFFASLNFVKMYKQCNFKILFKLKYMPILLAVGLSLLFFFDYLIKT